MSTTDWRPVYGVITTFIIGRFVVKHLLRRKDETPHPPGPKPKFLIGNALDMPLENASQVYLEWSKKFNSDILYMNALGNKIIVLNSREDADELFEKRARIYSDRPYVPTMKMMGVDFNFGFLPYGDSWRFHRRIAQQILRADAVHQLHPIQTQKVHEHLLGLLQTPERFEDHNKMLSLTIPLTTMYGYHAQSLDDPLIVSAERFSTLAVAVLSPGGSLVNVFPALRHVPWTWTQRMVKKIKALTDQVKAIPLESLKRDMANGKASPSFMTDFLERKQTVGASQEEEEAHLNVANTVYAAAADTTISATQAFFYLITAHPEVQAKAYAELDCVLGCSARLPTFEDRPHLPYIEAIYREVMRWCPPVSMGVPHATTEDDWYKGYFIPKGTTVFGNIWAMTHDERRYQDPMAFKPDRFFDENGNLNDDKRILAYGFGRRVCLGKYAASDMLWLMMASVLSCFKLGPKTDQNGHEIKMNDGFKEIGLMMYVVPFARDFGYLSYVRHKTPYECHIDPRSDKHRELILENAKPANSTGLVQVHA
ncbi:hypothetical protein CVT24_010974 [Panaeolus cyanescens]|uniref:Cytochrome P450 n=1 Tax=Panaeolus cyanescens TaxID=181874 RepID=A0A409YVS9_9AGAR|nr:hypothetical protein CVT24_010974 [Panaeolus cyanescens]